jgi:hypothetical protein
MSERGKGIFGLLAPKFVSTGESPITVNLDYADIVKNEPVTDYVELPSEITGERAFIKRGTHYEVQFKINLYKYSNPASKYADIMTYHGSTVTLWLHRDGGAYQTGSSTDALFLLKEVEPFFYESKDYPDYLLLTFVSVNVIVRDEAFTHTYQLEEIIMTDTGTI